MATTCMGKGRFRPYRSFCQAVVVPEELGQLREAADIGKLLQVGDDLDALQGALPEALSILHSRPAF